jgi:protein tyrosine phosphatase
MKLILLFKDSPYISNQRDNNQLGILLEFFERIARSNPVGMDMNTSPMIVHCSAGIGRSGATIAIDIILNRIRTEGFDIEIDIPSLVKHIRSQRSGLVQTERQYELIYRVIEYFVEKSQYLSDNSNKQ